MCALNVVKGMKLNMKDLKESLKIKNFVINPIILKNLKKLDINLNEFLLILYFINVKNELDLEDIKKHFDFNEEEVLSIFNSLISKKLIEIVMIKGKNGIEEEVSLEMFYDKLIMNLEVTEEKNDDIYSKFESEFGRTLSPMEYETISNWIYNKIPEETILKALKEAVLNGVTSLRYIDKILYEWNKKEIKTSKDDYVELFDYDWLDENYE